MNVCKACDPRPGRGRQRQLCCEADVGAVSVSHSTAVGVVWAQYESRVHAMRTRPPLVRQLERRGGHDRGAEKRTG